jgi:hypothetical protein
MFLIYQQTLALLIYTMEAFKIAQKVHLMLKTKKTSTTVPTLAVREKRSMHFCHLLYQPIPPVQIIS